MKLHLAGAAALSLIVTTALATTPDIGGTTPTPRCPDKKATTADEEWQHSGDEQVCAKNLKLADGSSWSPSCPEQLIIVPEHGECQGEWNPGTRCAPNGVQNVQIGDCTCGPILYISHWVIASCTCTGFLNAGTVEDFATKACEI